MKLKALIAGLAVVGLVAVTSAPTMAAGSGSGTGTTVPKPKPKKKKTTSAAPAAIIWSAVAVSATTAS